MASKKKGSKRKAPSSRVIRKVNVPRGTSEIIIHVTIGRVTGAKKMMKSGIEEELPDPTP